MNHNVLYAVLALVVVATALTELNGNSCAPGYSCFGTDCTGASPDKCLVYVGWKQVDSQRVEFRIEGNTTGWVTMCFSDDLRMGDDSCIDCFISSTGMASVQHSYNGGYGNSVGLLNSDAGISASSTSLTGGRVSCTLTRTIAPAPAHRELFDLSASNKYHLIVRTGGMANGLKMLHRDTPSISDKISFTSENFEPTTTIATTTPTTTIATTTPTTTIATTTIAATEPILNSTSVSPTTPSTTGNASSITPEVTNNTTTTTTTTTTAVATATNATLTTPTETITTPITAENVSSTTGVVVANTTETSNGTTTSSDAVSHVTTGIPLLWLTLGVLLLSRA